MFDSTGIDSVYPGFGIGIDSAFRFDSEIDSDSGIDSVYASFGSESILV